MVKGPFADCSVGEAIAIAIAQDPALAKNLSLEAYADALSRILDGSIKQEVEEVRAQTRRP